MKNLNFGWIKDYIDDRDFSATRLIYTEMPLTKTYFVYPSTPVYNQGSHPSCVGWACAGVKSDEEYTQHGHKYLFDGNWLYNECKKIDDIPSDGTSLRFAMQILQQQGIRQSTLPCQKREPDSFWEIGSYFRIDDSSTDDFIKQIILQYGSIALGSLWYSSWMDVKDVFPAPDTVYGGHAYRLCGWNDCPAGWWIVNSWGKSWGESGKAIMPYDIFKSAILDSGTDLWKLIDK